MFFLKYFRKCTENSRTIIYFKKIESKIKSIKNYTRISDMKRFQYFWVVLCYPRGRGYGSHCVPRSDSFRSMVFNAIPILTVWGVTRAPRRGSPPGTALARSKSRGHEIATERTTLCTVLRLTNIVVNFRNSQ